MYDSYHISGYEVVSNQNHIGCQHVFAIDRREEIDRQNLIFAI